MKGIQKKEQKCVYQIRTEKCCHKAKNLLFIAMKDHDHNKLRENSECLIGLQLTVYHEGKSEPKFKIGAWRQEMKQRSERNAAY